MKMCDNLDAALPLDREPLTPSERKNEWAPRVTPDNISLPGVKPRYLDRADRSVGHCVYTDCNILATKQDPSVRTMELDI